ncbi:MAG: hypothetical protein NVSMB51_02470 [Solirubrobacteraceae bacterium]
MKHAATLFSAVALAASLAACGSGGGLQRDALARQGNQICRDGQKKLAGIGSAPSDFRTNPTAAAAFLDRYVPIIDEVAAKLKALKPADAVKADWNAFESKFAQSTAYVDKARTKAHNKDSTGVQDIKAAAQLGTATNAAASKVGTSVCAR